MLIKIFRPAASESARILAGTLRSLGLNARRVRRLRHPEHEERVVCWGAFNLGLPPMTALNNLPLLSKLSELDQLSKSGIPAPDWSIITPPTHWTGWVGRAANHHGGLDLLNPGTFTPSYWVKREKILKEFRIHIWNKGEECVSIKAGRKIPKLGVMPHPWVRSLEGGWRIIYDGLEVRPRHRKLAKQAIQALALNFGAVDIGEMEDGSLIVFEVNRAPGLGSGTALVYAQRIKEWASGQDT